MRVKTVALSLLYLILTACSSVADLPSQIEVKVEAPEKVLQSQFSWILEILNDRDGKLTRDEVHAHFDRAFLLQVSADQVVGIFSQLSGQLGKVTVSSSDPVVSPSPGVQTLITHAGTKGGNIRIILSIDTKSGLINGLFVQPDTGQTTSKAMRFNDAERQLKDLVPESGFVVAELLNGKCYPKYEVNSTQVMAIGSSFKVYVLYSLLDQVRNKKLNWHDTIAIRDDWKSLPSGRLQFEAAGTKFTMEKLAEQMIAASDNTATDHVLHSIGRERVETAIRLGKLNFDDRNVPLLATREFFF